MSGLADSLSEGWEKRVTKHIFVLSSSGKPIFTRYGDEQEMVTTFGLLQAMVSVVQDQGDNVRCIKAGSRRIVYFIRKSLYFICVSSTGEPESVMVKHLEFIYSQILLMLTNKVHSILDQDSSKDLRDLLGGDATRLMGKACEEDIVPPCIAFNALQGYIIDSQFRTDIVAALRRCVHSSGAALGMLIKDDALVAYGTNDDTPFDLDVSDVLLLSHFVGNSNSLRSHDQNWVPICLPNFNAGAIMQAYICNLRINSTTEESKHLDLSLILVSASADPMMFKELHDGREMLEQELLKPKLAKRFISSLDQSKNLQKHLTDSHCLHFLFKVRTTEENIVPAQCTSTTMEFPIDSSSDFIWTQYQRIALCLRAGNSVTESTLINKTNTADDSFSEVNLMSQLPASDHALAYTRLGDGNMIIGLATSDSELYATFSESSDALDACGKANFLSRSLRTDKANIFMLSSHV